MTHVASSPHKLLSLLYCFLVHTALPADRLRLSSYWNRLWAKCCKRFQGPVIAKIHGQFVVVNFGFTYPLYARKFHNLNAPLLELAYQTWQRKAHSIFVVDVGAAVGDSVLFLRANLPGAFDGFLCVDGDPEFYVYLQKNLNHLKGVRFVHALLSDTEESIPDLVRIHTGTASAQSQIRRSAIPLSKLIDEHIDLLKIDVDGFDGRVLMGALNLLKRYHPSVIFEWHPILCHQSGNNWTDHFDVLTNAGYTRFLWYDKYGSFSHFTSGHRGFDLDALAEYCLSDISSDWHYDIIALHDTSDISPQALATLRFSKERPSRF